ncbi:hypothetical protein BLJAPNOD_02920 [Ensifer sp. M14]|uniref:hypothetical protein n=1 Tax=Ensifer sp. M14 TaxID=2203782 RepID=UPI000E2D2E4F|nr:hypothetical protein [Ensifer sp. M14]RDL51779.1 hypothetical protein BLJAPNOD_02920 [Ensifer sp. M14]
MTTDPLSQLPLFATDRQLAVAIVGKERAAMWIKAVIPQLERKGFPRIDPLHDGRPVPLVRKFYDGYFGITVGFSATAPDGEENWDWHSKRQRREERKPQLGLSTRCLSALRYMVEHPDVRTSAEIPGARDFTLEQLANAGALGEGKRDGQGDRTWTVTDLGREEIARIDDWHRGKPRRS